MVAMEERRLKKRSYAQVVGGGSTPHPQGSLSASLPSVLRPAPGGGTQSAGPSAGGAAQSGGQSAGGNAQSAGPSAGAVPQRSRAPQDMTALTADGASSIRPKLLLEVASSTTSTLVVALADTGASTTLVTRGVADRIKLAIRDTEIELTGLNGRASTVGESAVGLRVSGVDQKFQTRVIVVESLPEGQEALLSCSFLKRFGLIHQDFPKPCRSAGDTVYVEPDTSRPASGDPGVRLMEEAFMISKVDSEPLTIDRTVFRQDEDDNVEDIPGLMQLPAILETASSGTCLFMPTICLPREISSASPST